MSQQQPHRTTARAPVPALAAPSTATTVVAGQKRGATTTTPVAGGHGLVSCSLTLLLLALLSWAPELASGASSSSSWGLCLGKAQACYLDEVCKECLGSWSPDNVDDACLADVAELLSTSSGDCGTAGIQTCCGFEAGTSEACMENTLMVEYWECIQSGNGCDLNDIPCYGLDEEGTALTVSEEEAQTASNGATAEKMRSSSSSCLLLASAIAAAAAAAAAATALV